MAAVSDVSAVSQPEEGQGAAKEARKQPDGQEAARTAMEQPGG